jgi:hypothetical protein
MIVGGAVLLVALGAMYLKGKVSGAIGSAVDSVGDFVSGAAPYVNPADPRNFVNAGLGYVGTAATGNPDWSLGTSLYDMTHQPGGKSVLDYINPASDRNVIYGTQSAIGAAVTGNPDWSLGTQIYDWFN